MTEMDPNTEKYIDKITSHKYLGVVIPVPLTINGEKEFSLRQKRRGIRNLADAIKLVTGITPFVVSLEKNFDDGKGVFGTDIGVPLLGTIVHAETTLKKCDDDTGLFVRQVLDEMIEKNRHVAFVVKFKNDGMNTIHLMGKFVIGIKTSLGVSSYPIGIDTDIQDGEYAHMKIIMTRDL